MSTVPFLSWGVVSSSPPTACGIATFTTALGTALTRRGDEVRIVRIVQTGDEAATSPFEQVAALRADDPWSIDQASAALNRCDVALIQHEFGLYGGRDGEDVVAVMAAVQVPVVTILHTVLVTPTVHQRALMNRVISLSTCVVVMSNAALATLRLNYHLGDVVVRVIPHGAAVGLVPADSDPTDRAMLLTWGLIGPGKGIEWVIDALAFLRDLEPTPFYVVAGRTHPKVLAFAGDTYRHGLERRVQENGVGDMVFFDNHYRSLASLNSLISASAMVVLPYDSPEQSTSGVLVDAIAAGRPVVATSFPHSVEMLSSGAGLIVGHRDPAAIAAAIRSILTNPAVAGAMTSEARRIAPSLSWDAVALRYLDLSRSLLRSTHWPVSA